MGAHLVGVPQADGAAQGQFPHQQVVHPAERKLQVSHFVPVQMAVNSLCTTQAQAVREPQGKRTSSTNEGLHSSRRKQIRGWRDNSDVKSTHCSYRGSGFNDQHQDGSSQPFQFRFHNPISFSDLWGTRHTHAAHSYKVPTHIKMSNF